ncbi:MAG: DNA polymerase III subunit gamma/tau [Bacteroidetes bacterium]|jgi:DNA polymerase-3 subunit gamma/tau|nr:DNA polymerase III subunit gamma/tau [Bacteroidota bacterium]
MENFVVSARKYRPAMFNSVVGQTAITSTLKNAIKSHHLASAFLFCGPRGVGKTTCARILAKTINCTNLTSETEACNQCESCKSFNDGQAIDIMELDAASNNSVDDIRNLVDTVRIPPQMLESNPNAKKVYVIDEVHMLSASAFNAFLKTLEEPPSYAIFILATTERHKILPTILSRCQIFNFNRIQVEDIANHLAFIAKSENVEAEPDALHVIAQKADGALRDACSIFDQVVSFAGNKLTYKAVIENLNVLDYDYYFRMTDDLLAENIPGSLLIFNEILSNGFDGHNFISGLAEHFRNLLVCKDPATLVLLETGQNIRERYKSQSEKCAVPFLLRALKVVNNADINYKSARNPRLIVEFALMQLTAISGTLVAGEKKNDEPQLIFGTKASPLISQNSPAVEKKVSEEKSIAIEEKTPVKGENSIQNEELKIQNSGTASAPVVKKTLLKSSPSISSFTKPTEEAKKTTTNISDIGQAAEDFSQEQLEKAWSGFSETLKVQKRQMDYATFTGNKPVLVAKDLVTFTVLNTMAEERINEDKTELMTFLRKQLRNFVFKLEIIVSKEEGESMIFTAQDRFKKLAEINPDIQKLKQAFDLDVDY